MKTVKVIIILFIGVNSIQAQYPMIRKSNKNFQFYLDKPMIAVLSGNASFDDSLKAAISEHWPEKTIRFLLKKEIDTLKSKKEYSYLGVLKRATPLGNKEMYKTGYAIYVPEQVPYQYVGTTNILGPMPEYAIICWVPLSCSKFESNKDFRHDLCSLECNYEHDIDYKINLIINKLITARDTAVAINYKYLTPSFGGIGKFEKIINKHLIVQKRKALTKKIILINSYDLNEKCTKSDLQKICKFPIQVEVVPPLTFMKLVKKRDPKYLALFVTYNPWAQISLYDLSQNKLLYIGTNSFIGSTNREVLINKQIKRMVLD